MGGGRCASDVKDGLKRTNTDLCQPFTRFLDFVEYEFAVRQQKVDKGSLTTSLNATGTQLDVFSRWSQMLGKTLSGTASIPKTLGPFM